MFHMIFIRSYPFFVRFPSGDSVPCPVISGGVRSVRSKVLNMFKSFHRTKRSKSLNLIGYRGHMKGFEIY